MFRTKLGEPHLAAETNWRLSATDAQDAPDNSGWLMLTKQGAW